mmetsp:Transcript_25877/g.64640  ORF Transcript_25877/g.64640 Transcript_25877/m.64640 type:complete len:204 (+) Transcript_25877:589-1200(+)
MNPGPFGMAQTGVPFGDVAMVRDWMLISDADGPVGTPARENPNRKIAGFACPRSEVSGTRLWGWARDHYGTPSDPLRFFSHFFVHNYCPLVFMSSSGRNVPPNTLAPAPRAAVTAACDVALAEVLRAVRPEVVVGVGEWTAARVKAVVDGMEEGKRPKGVGKVLHPSPASPAANRGWAEAATKQMDELLAKHGVVLEQDVGSS